MATDNSNRFGDRDGVIPSTELLVGAWRATAGGRLGFLTHVEGVDDGVLVVSVLDARYAPEVLDRGPMLIDACRYVGAQVTAIRCVVV